MTKTPDSWSTPLTLPQVCVARPIWGMARFASSTSCRRPSRTRTVTGRSPCVVTGLSQGLGEAVVGGVPADFLGELAGGGVLVDGEQFDAGHGGVVGEGSCA
jgi:hypothetical protein